MIAGAPPIALDVEDTPEDDELTQVLDTYFAGLESGRPTDPQRLLAEHPAIADRLRVCLSTLQLLPRSGTGSDAARHALPRFADYEVLREAGRGGMGVVYEAQQRSLGRRVALKTLPLAATLDPRRLQRFKNEAQAAAQLRHPNIVPVYALGCEHGVHYYVMLFVEGQSLAHLLRDRTILVARDVADLGAQAATALEFAHQCGVVHRDIKPANLLLETHSPSPREGGGRGEGARLWITDFGLARLADQPELTQTGDLVGTLRYMSPEQALGSQAPVDHRADVYGLGATLYELLTLHPVHDGAERSTLLHQIEQDEPVPPRRLNPAIPVDLETIVLKALAKEPAERYATAQELADDLKRFLGDKPIRARRPGAVRRLGKWMRRHRTMLATLLAGIVLATAASAVLLWRAYRAEGVQRTRAKERQQLALKSAVRMAHAAEELLRSVPRLNKGQRDVLEGALTEALAVLETLRQESPTEAEVRRQTAVAYFRIGNLRNRLGQRAESEHAYRQAVALFQDLAHESPGNRDDRFWVFRATTALASALPSRPREQEQLLWQALALAEQLWREDLPNPAYRDAVARVYANLGIAHYHGKREFVDAERLLRKGLDVAGPLVREVPDRPDYARSLGRVLYGLSGVLNDTGRTAEAVSLSRRAVEVGMQVLATAPEDTVFRNEMVGYLAACIDVRVSGRWFDDVGAFLDEAQRLTRQQLQDHPEDQDSRAELAEIRRKYWNFHQEVGRPEQAQQAYQDYVRLRLAIAHDLPEDAFHQVGPARVLADGPYPDLHDPELALQLAQKAITLAPDEPSCIEALGLVHARRREWPASLEALERLGDRPQPRTIGGWFLRALAQWHLGRHADARRTYDEAVRYLAGQPYLDPDARRYRAEAAELLGIAEPP